MDPDERQKTGGSTMKENINFSQIPHVGAKHICVDETFNLEVEVIGFTQTEKEFTLSESQRIPSMNFFAVYSYTITDLGNNRALLTTHIKPEEGHELPMELFSVFKAMEEVGIKSLKAYAEKKLR